MRSLNDESEKKFREEAFRRLGMKKNIQQVIEDGAGEKRKQ
jgi:hypothetical protein